MVPETINLDGLDHASDRMSLARQKLYAAGLALNQLISLRGRENGLASLDSQGHIPESQLCPVLLKRLNLSDVPDKSSARSNLGIPRREDVILRTGSRLTGAVSLTTDGTDSLHAVRKSYVDTGLSTKAGVGSPTFTSPPTVPVPVAEKGIANKRFLDDTIRLASIRGFKMRVRVTFTSTRGSISQTSPPVSSFGAGVVGWELVGVTQAGVSSVSGPVIASVLIMVTSSDPANLDGLESRLYFQLSVHSDAVFAFGGIHDFSVGSVNRLQIGQDFSYMRQVRVEVSVPQLQAGTVGLTYPETFTLYIFD